MMIKIFFIGTSISTFIYWSLAWQVSMGWPPFYRRPKSKLLPSNEELVDFVHYFISAIGSLLLGLILSVWTGFYAFLFISVGGLVYSAWSIRTDIKRVVDGPLPWVATYTSSPAVFPYFNGQPMLLFDVWTIGLSGLTGLITLIVFVSIVS
ncbi:hypothetical protein IWQ54_001731 [Labrenzia sp. EL_195]|nr:hypothetical protein [Labrenzia sp. EL_195]